MSALLNTMLKLPAHHAATCLQAYFFGCRTACRITCLCDWLPNSKPASLTVCCMLHVYLTVYCLPHCASLFVFLSHCLCHFLLSGLHALLLCLHHCLHWCHFLSVRVVAFLLVSQWMSSSLVSALLPLWLFVACVPDFLTVCCLPHCAFLFSVRLPLSLAAYCITSMPSSLSASLPLSSICLMLVLNN